MTTSYNSDLTSREAGEPTRLRMELTVLLARVSSARDREQALVRGIHRWRDRPTLDDARLATLDALLDYAAGIEALSWPVPRSLLLEIQMHQIMCGTTRR